METNCTFLALLSGKGGSGKTVIALAIGRALAAAGCHLLLVDCDTATHGATYFFEPDLGERSEPTATLDRLEADQLESTPLPTRVGFDFLPSTLDPAASVTFTERLDRSSGREIMARVKEISETYQVAILDCQAGFSPLVHAAVEIAHRNLIVLEPDAVSSAALRVLYLQLGDKLGSTNTWQIFNKLSEEERPVYEKIRGGTLFPSLPPIPFDWQVRAAFATRQIPTVLERSSAFGLGVLRTLRTLLPPFEKKIDLLERETVGNWYSDIKGKLDSLDSERISLTFEAADRRRQVRLQRLRWLTSSILAIPLVIGVLALPDVRTYFGLDIWKVAAAVVSLVAALGAVTYYILALRDMRAEFEQDRTQEAISSIEREIDRYSTLIATDPGLREYDRRLGERIRVAD